VAGLALRGVTKRFGVTEAVRGVDLDVPHEEFLVLVGPSGCGKSTLLRMIAGLEDTSGGEIVIDGRVVNELEPKDRDIAMVFQDYALYPHMSVFENMAFGLRYRGVARAEIRSRVLEAARTLAITELLERKPRQLSGGQRQRVAMGRAIVRHPKVFLFDEPLSNLDAQLRVAMRTEIKRLHRKVRTTVVYVTHDQVEAMTLADRIVVMRGGLIEQAGSPDEIYARPASVFVAQFIGAPTMNLVPARLERAGAGTLLRLPGGAIVTLPPARLEALGDCPGELLIGIRPEHLHWAEQPIHDPGITVLEAVAYLIEPLGSDTLVFFHQGERELVARVPPGAVRAPGERFSLTLDAAAIHLFDPVSERRLC